MSRVSCGQSRLTLSPLYLVNVQELRSNLGSVVLELLDLEVYHCGSIGPHVVLKTTVSGNDSFVER